MRITLLALAAAAIAISAVPVYAEEADGTKPSLSQPVLGPEPGPGQGVQAPPPAPPAAGPSQALLSDGGSEAAAQPAGADGGDSGGPKPWKIPQLPALKNLGIVTYGWIEQGFTCNTLSPTDRSNGPLYLNDRSNDYELNQLWLGFARPVKTDGCGFDIGGRIDLCYGSDWRYGDCLGLESRIDSPSELNGLVIPQFYLEVGIDDLTVQIGHFAAGMGYEMVPAPNNFFYSHDYCFGYSEAVLVTGVQADYKFSDQWDLIGGFNRGWNMFEDNNDCLDFLGGVKWHNDDKSTILSYEIDVGAQDAAGADNQYAYALVLQQKLTDKLLYVAQHNLGGTETPRAGVPYGMWYGLDQYLIYTYSPTLSFGSRLEFFRDNNGTRVAGIGNVSAAFTGVTGSGWDAAPGFAGTFNEVTLGLNWRPHPSVVLRPEFRYDWYNGTSNLQGQRPFGDGTQNNQITMAMDLVITY